MKTLPLLVLAMSAFANVARAQLLLTEIQSSQASAAAGAKDYWELTNFGNTAVPLAGYTWDDSGRSYAAAQAWALSAGSSIAPGESVIFTTAVPADFRAWWGIPASVQVFQTPGAPGLGQGDGVSFFSNTGTELFYLSYAAGGFTRTGGLPSGGGDAGLSAGGTLGTQALIYDPKSLPGAPRFTSASGTNFGSFQAAGGVADYGSPGKIDKLVDLSTYVRVGRYDLPEPTRTTPPAVGNLLCQEASGVAYDWDTDSLVIVGDGGRSVTKVSKTGALISSMTLASGSFNDTEGVAYVGNGQFVFSEERERQLVKFTYAAGGTLSRAGAQTVKLGTTVGNDGTEGFCFDRQNGGFIVLREKGPVGIFATYVDFLAGTATNGSPVTVNSINLFNPALLGMSDAADVFAMPDRRLLVVSQENGKIVNISRTGVISSTLNIIADPGNPLSVDDHQHEGITMDDSGNLYLVNENGGGDTDHPQLWVYAPISNAPPSAVVAINATTTIAENTDTSSAIKVADLVVTDDGLGTNTLSLAGVDAAFFQIIGNSLYLKSGTVLDFETKSSYSITLRVDDASVGNTPDATANFSLTVTDVVDENPAGPPLIISEVAAWSNLTGLGYDWIELTNTTNAAITLTGWKVDDASNSFGSGGFLGGVTSIAPGKSAVFFMEMTAAAFPAKATQFIDIWFGGTAPAGFQIGYIDAGGLGLGLNGDEVNLYNPAGLLKAKVSFGASSGAPPFATFDNATSLDGTAISLLSVAGVSGAFVAAGDANQIGSPGAIANVSLSGFQAWLAAKGYTSGGFDQDSDKDGLTDGQEYFFGLNPNHSADAGGALKLLGDGGGLSLGFSLLNGVTGASGVLQVSSDLLDWTAAVQGVDYVPTSAVVNGDRTDYLYSLPGATPGDPPRFFRFNVIEQ